MIGTEHSYLELEFVLDVVDANVNVDGVDVLSANSFSC